MTNILIQLRGLIFMLFACSAIAVENSWLGEPAKIAAKGPIADVALNGIANAWYLCGQEEKGGYVGFGSLDEQGQPSGSLRYLPLDQPASALAIVPMGRKLIVLGSGPKDNLLVFSMGSRGEITEPADKYTVGTAPKALLLDAARSRLYVADNAPQGEANLYVCDLDSQGKIRPPRAFPSGSKLMSLALDAGRNKLYIGRNGDDRPRRDHDLEICDLDAQGNPVGKTKPYQVTCNAIEVAVDPCRHKLYVAGHFLSDHSVFWVDLDEKGNPASNPIASYGPWYPLSLCLGRSQKLLIIGGGQHAVVRFDPRSEWRAHRTGGNLFNYGYSFSTCLLDEVGARLYCGNNGLPNSLLVYPVKLAALKPLSILRNEKGASGPAIKLDLRLGNARWIRLGGDIATMDSLVAQVNRWMSVDQLMQGAGASDGALVISAKVKNAKGANVVTLLEGPRSGATIYREFTAEVDRSRN